MKTAVNLSGQQGNMEKMLTLHKQLIKTVVAQETGSCVTSDKGLSVVLSAASTFMPVACFVSLVCAGYFLVSTDTTLLALQLVVRGGVHISAEHSHLHT